MSFFSGIFTFSKALFKSRVCPIYIKFSFKTWNVVFFGSDNFSLPSLKLLYKNVGKKIKKLEIVTVNNSNPVYLFAISNDLTTYLWPPAFNTPYDFGVVVSFGKFIPKTIIDLFSFGIINVHPSLLPRWRGAMPIIHTLKSGDVETGISIIKISHEKFDVGEILLQKTVAIGKHELMPSLYNRLSYLGSEFLEEVIEDIPECFLKSSPQSKEKVCYAPKLKQEASVVKWDEMTAEEIYNLYRALFGAFDLRTFWSDGLIKITCLSLNEYANKKGEQTSPGTFYYDAPSQRLVIQCRENSLKICSLKFRGKLYTAKNFWRGYLNKNLKATWQFHS